MITFRKDVQKARRNPADRHVVANRRGRNARRASVRAHIREKRCVVPSAAIRGIAKAQLKSYGARLQYRLAELSGALITAAGLASGGLPSFGWKRHGRVAARGALSNSHMKCAKENLRQLATIYRCQISRAAGFATARPVLFRHASRAMIGGIVLNWLRRIPTALCDSLGEPHQEESSYEPALPPQSIFLRQLCSNLV
jgi:hypothetical protein